MLLQIPVSSQLVVLENLKCMQDYKCGFISLSNDNSLNIQDIMQSQKTREEVLKLSDKEGLLCVWKVCA